MGLCSNRNLLVVCGFAATLLFAFAAHAQKPGDRRFPFGLAEGRLMTEIAEDLGLAEDTLAAIEAASKQQKEEETKLMEEHSAAWEKLSALLDEGLPSEKALLEASTAFGETMAKMRDSRLRYTRLVRGLLTSEQLESYSLRRKAVPLPAAGGGGARRR